MGEFQGKDILGTMTKVGKKIIRQKIDKSTTPRHGEQLLVSYLMGVKICGISAVMLCPPLLFCIYLSPH
jgi:hypothetical protein